MSQIFLKLHIDEDTDSNHRVRLPLSRSSEPERLALRSTDLRERH